ncbi:hypothetical protein CJU89_4483 [Yarrowia sp. B02]|nr:hypothetical protein CJU89_4483 [Yarrowia sp. B02]
MAKVTKRKTRRSTKGCTVCLARKKKCDETWPVCNSCERLGHECKWRDKIRFRKPDVFSPDVLAKYCFEDENRALGEFEFVTLNADNIHRLRLDEDDSSDNSPETLNYFEEQKRQSSVSSSESVDLKITESDVFETPAVIIDAPAVITEISNHASAHSSISQAIAPSPSLSDWVKESYDPFHFGFPFSQGEFEELGDMGGYVEEIEDEPKTEPKPKKSKDELNSRALEKLSLTLQIPKNIDVLTYLAGGQDDAVATERQLWNQWLSISVPTNSVTPSDKSALLVVLLPLSISSSAVRSAILAWTCTQMYNLCRIQESVVQKFCDDKERTNLLVAATRQPPQWRTQADIDALFAATLIWCAVESTTGGTSWINYMKASSELIRSQGGEIAFLRKNKTKTRAWLLRNFLYHDVIASLSIGIFPLCQEGAAFCYTKVSSKKTHLSDEETETREFLLSKGVNELDSLIGRCHNIFYILWRIGGLSHERICFAESALALCDGLLRQVDESEMIDDEGLDESEREPAILMHNLYHRTAVICLYVAAQRLKQNFAAHYHPDFDAIIPESQVLASVEYIIGVSETLQPGEPPESCITFPLFVAGCVASDKTTVDRVNTRLKKRLSEIGYANGVTAATIVEMIWQQRCGLFMNGQLDSISQWSSNLDWVNVIRRTGITPLLS